MGRIADAAVAELDHGPADVRDLAARLGAVGVTRAKDPVAAVRRALRGDARVLALSDGRFAAAAQAFANVVFTARVGMSDHARGAVELDADLAPLTLLGVGRAVLPADARPGDHVVVRVVDAVRGRVDVERAPGRLDEAAGQAVVAFVRERLAQAGPRASLRRVRLADAVAEIAATDPAAFRSPARPLSEVLREAGLEIHLGWVAPTGTRWGALTELEIEALERGVSDHLAADRPLEAAELQDRLVSTLRRHLPERVPAARRRLARVLARAGRARDGLAVLTGAFGFDDPEDRYEASLLAIRLGDTRAARRWAEEGLARAEGAAHASVRTCLEDLAGDLDAQAAYRAAQDALPEDLTSPRAVARLAAQIVAPRRSYLVGALVEQAVAGRDDLAVQALVAAFGRLDGPGRDACLACEAVLDGAAADAARRAAGDARWAERPWVQGLLDAAPLDAWITAPGAGSRRQHLIMAIAKEEGRWAPLVVVIDRETLGGAAQDAFFLNDLAAERFRRELLRPIEELGLPLRHVPLAQAVVLLEDALAATDARGWALPALEYQPVVARIRRFVLGGVAGRVPPDASR